MQSTSAVSMIVFLKEHFGLPSSPERSEEESLRGCRLGLRVFGKGRGLAKRKLSLIPVTTNAPARSPLSGSAVTPRTASYLRPSRSHTAGDRSPQVLVPHGAARGHGSPSRGSRGELREVPDGGCSQGLPTERTSEELWTGAGQGGRERGVQETAQEGNPRQGPGGAADETVFRQRVRVRVCARVHMCVHV